MFGERVGMGKHLIVAQKLELTKNLEGRASMKEYGIKNSFRYTSILQGEIR